MNIESLSITPEMLKLISELDEFRGAWSAFSHMSMDKLESLKRVATIESIASSTRIEGSTLSDAEVEKLLRNIGKTSFGTRDEQEVLGYAEVMDTIFENFKEIPLSENYIKQLHGALLRHTDKDSRHRGAYKKLDNHVEAIDAEGKSLGVVFKTATPFDTPSRMERLISQTNSLLEDKSIHPLITIGLFIVDFLAIHPFQDGNGRLSRVLTTLLLLRTGYKYVIFSSLEKVVEANKEKYYLALRRTQGTLEQEQPDWIPWLIFYLRCLKTQKDELKIKIESEDKNSDLHPEEIKILDYLKKHNRITTSEALELLNSPRPTVKKRLSDLVAKNLITLKGKGRGAYYVLNSVKT